MINNLYCNLRLLLFINKFFFIIVAKFRNKAERNKSKEMSN